MACGLNCAFSGNAPLSEQFNEIVVTGGVYAIAAVGVNFLVLYVAGVEDVTPAVIGGSMSALGTCGTHRLRHALAEDGKVKEWTDRDRVFNSAFRIFVSMGSTALLLRQFKYPVKKWAIIRMETLSILAIAGTQYVLNEGN